MRLLGDILGSISKSLQMNTDDVELLFLKSAIWRALGQTAEADQAALEVSRVASSFDWMDIETGRTIGAATDAGTLSTTCA